MLKKSRHADAGGMPIVRIVRQTAPTASHPAGYWQQTPPTVPCRAGVSSHMVQPPKEVHGLLFLITGPPGTNRTNLCRRLVAAHLDIERVVTCTTRPPRLGEQDRVDYFFLSDAQFDEARANDEFFEWTQTHGARFGTRKDALSSKLSYNVDLVINVDVRGARVFRQAFEADANLRSRLVRIFVTLPNAEALQKHMEGHQGELAEHLEQRMKTALQEMEQWTQQDYCIVMGTDDEDFARLESIWRAEKCQVARLRQAAIMMAAWMRAQSQVPFEMPPA